MEKTKYLIASFAGGMLILRHSQLNVSNKRLQH